MSASNGDTCYFEGKLDDAARFYATAMKHAPSMDPNNNGGDNDNGELTWVTGYLDKKMVEVEEKLKLKPGIPSNYLEKASILFLQDKWHEARDVLVAGLQQCNEKAEIRATIGSLNKLERSFASIK